MRLLANLPVRRTHFIIWTFTQFVGQIKTMKWDFFLRHYTKGRNTFDLERRVMKSKQRWTTDGPRTGLEWSGVERRTVVLGFLQTLHKRLEYQERAPHSLEYTRKYRDQNTEDVILVLITFEGWKYLKGGFEMIIKYFCSNECIGQDINLPSHPPQTPYYIICDNWTHQEDHYLRQSPYR